MAIRDKKSLKDRGIEIDLTGREGNAFFLLATANNYAVQLGLDAKSIENEMKEGDYENLVNTFDKYFGDYVTMLR